MSKDQSVVVMPIGKYKGQPVEILREDASYKEWLLAQNWFKDKFGDIHTLILNNFQTPHNTPEHNALQARFLETGWLAEVLDPTKDIELRDLNVEFESAGYDVLINCYFRRLSEWEPRLKDYQEKLALLPTPIPDNENNIRFDSKGKLIAISALSPRNQTTEWCNLTYWSQEGGWGDRSLGIQLKPVIGDDYPAILRALKHAPEVSAKCLFYLEYTGAGVSEDTFLKIMDNEKIWARKLLS